jgi:glycosyltransferase involved in cell wall biosynthesis
VKYAILTPTYQRPESLTRTITSVRAQTGDYIHIIINDSPDHDYTTVVQDIQTDSRIHYIANDDNIGKNASVNRALEYLRNIAFDGYIVFLDDDDWLGPTCLADFSREIEESNALWVVSDRAYTDGTSITHNYTGRRHISYLKDYLLRRTFTGDATHAIHFPTVANVSFPFTIKNAEEWIYFASVATRIPTFIYCSAIGTYSDGYLADGLSKSVGLVPLQLTVQEIQRVRLYTPYALLYFILRVIKRTITSI